MVDELRIVNDDDESPADRYDHLLLEERAAATFGAIDGNVEVRKGIEVGERDSYD